MKMPWKITSAIILSTMLLCSTADAVISSSRPQVPKNFENVTATTYHEYWKNGEEFKSNGNQENPDLFGRQWRKASTNSISLVTPRTIVGYIAFSNKQRLIDVPANFEQIMEKHNDLLYVATWTSFQRMGMFGEGGINPQLPTQRLVIEKDGVLIRPQVMPPEIEALMPHSFGLVYYSFPRSVILNAPYTIKWVTGYGDILKMDVPQELIDSLIDDEYHFYNSNKGLVKIPLNKSSE